MSRVIRFCNVAALLAKREVSIITAFHAVINSPGVIVGHHGAWILDSQRCNANA